MSQTRQIRLLVEALAEAFSCSDDVDEIMVEKLNLMEITNFIRKGKPWTVDDVNKIRN